VFQTFRVFQKMAALVVFLGAAAQAQNLQVTYGSNGVQTVSYGNTVLENVATYPGDAFHVYHMQVTDLQGNVVSSGQYGWGENNNSRTWDSSTKTWDYRFSWGSITTQFAQSGNDLNMVVTETNNAGSGIIFEGAEIYPFALHFPRDPAGFNGNSQFAITTTGPGVSAADFGTGVVTSVIPNEAVALYGGWVWQSAATYEPLMTSTAPSELASYMPSNNVPVQPGASFSYTVSLRFTPEGTANAAANASDAYASFVATYPNQMNWPDRRIIGTAFLASSPASSGNITQPGGYPTNPRRYFNDPTVDINSKSGLQAFQDRILAQAQANVINAQAMNAQGVITWDMEGEEYPQDTSYACSPDQIAAVSPEMETTITDASSEYHGQRLDDAYFKIMTSAGLKVGVCVRPQVFTLGANSTASQVFLSTDAEIVANLENKAKYANSRWGVTIFYVDSTVYANGGTLNPAIFQQLSTDLPSFLFCPEESTPRYYAYSAPFYSFIFHTSLGTPASTYNFYPKAFGVNMVNDVAASTLAEYEPQLLQSVKNGDVLMGHADYWQANDPTLVAIYEAAGVAPVAPAQATPTISWAAPAAITYGTALSGAQLDASASAPGSFTYSPGAGTVLTAGSHSLTATFTPGNTADYRSTTASVSLTVAKATPKVAWSAPAAISYGTALGSAQLNATASVPGSFAYSPAAGTVLSVGTSTLEVTFTPADATDYAPVTSSVKVTVGKTAPTVKWTSPAGIAYGTALSGTQLNATANVAGSFRYSPAAGTVLPVGTSTLEVTFTPTNEIDFEAVSTSVKLTVAKVTPVIKWNAPSAIAYGTALSGMQLNATANVSGTFVYSPAAGTLPSAGTDKLAVTFTPTNGSVYASATASVDLTVSKVTPTLKWSAPAAISYGTALSGTQLNATANVAGTFRYSPAAGAVPGAGTDTLEVTFTPANSTDYASVTASVHLTVNAVAPAVTWSAPAAISYGTALSGTQLNAKASVAGVFSYSPAAGAVLPVGANTLEVMFTPSDAKDFLSAKTTVKLTVNASAPVAPSLSWKTPASIGYGTALSGTQLDAAANVAGKFTYSPALGTVLAPGTHTLQVTFVPANATSYKTGTASVSVTVTKVTPTISWPAPAAIASGTALSSEQLNAKASVAGSFSYSPALGAVPTAGTQTLKVTFTPSNQTDYAATTASVTLAVNAAGKLSILTPSAGASLSGSVVVTGQCSLSLDSAGTYLMVDGVEVGTHRVTSAPFVYSLSTTTLTNGAHTLQLWGHDISNNVTLSAPVKITVKN
jgi:hypothetical protein